MMVTTLRSTKSRVGFDHRSSSKLTTPKNQRVFQEPSLLQILNQRRTCLIRCLAIAGDIALHIAVSVPTAVENRDAPDAAFNHPSGEQARSSE